MSRVIVIAALVFVGVASSVLVWEGLASGVVHGRAAAAADLRRVRLRFGVGVIGFAIVLWIAFGLLTHAW